jgi:hypothetical protein
VLGPDGLSRSDDLRRREAAHSAMLYAFDLIEHDGQIFVISRSSTAGPPWQGFCGIPRQESCSTSTSRKMGLRSSLTLADLMPRASFQNGWIALIDPGRAMAGSRFGIRPASRCKGSTARNGKGDLGCLSPQEHHLHLLR